MVFKDPQKAILLAKSLTLAMGTFSLSNVFNLDFNGLTASVRNDFEVR
jgi:hypothetical protein